MLGPGDAPTKAAWPTKTRMRLRTPLGFSDPPTEGVTATDHAKVKPPLLDEPKRRRASDRGSSGEP